MAIDLAQFEKGERFVGNYAEALADVQNRLARLQVSHIVHKRRSIILFEGWDAAGKGGVIQRLTAGWDPRAFHVWPIGAPTDYEKARHYLWRFWQRLPPNGQIAIFDRSWYGRVLVERVEELATPAEWRRAYDEINEFEAQQREDSTRIIKIFLHVTQETQDERLLARLRHPWKRWKITADDFRNRAKRSAYLDAIQDMLAHTDTRWAPWHILDANNKKATRLAALNYIADQLEQQVPADPPEMDAAVLAEAQRIFGISFGVPSAS